MTQPRRNLLSFSRTTTTTAFLRDEHESSPAYRNDDAWCVLIFEGEKWKASLPRGRSVAERLAKLEQNPKRAAALARARVKVAGLSAEAGQKSLAALRLSAGLSQAQLAEKMGTKQSNISRWEHEPTSMQVSSIVKLAEALGVSDGTIYEIVKSTIKEQAIG